MRATAAAVSIDEPVATRVVFLVAVAGYAWAGAAAGAWAVTVAAAGAGVVPEGESPPHAATPLISPRAARAASGRRAARSIGTASVAGAQHFPPRLGFPQCARFWQARPSGPTRSVRPSSIQFRNQRRRISTVVWRSGDPEFRGESCGDSA